MKLVTGLLSSDPDLLRRARQMMTRRWGPTDLESDIQPFDQTDYYEDEMGPDLLRQFLSFERLIRPEAIAETKRETCKLEETIAEQTLAVVPRPVNVDPGYLDVGKLVLATTKDATHRIYLGLGVYAESTLRYVHGEWQSWPWTYPDYQREETRAFFARARELFLEQRKAFLDDSAANDAADQPYAE